MPKLNGEITKPSDSEFNCDGDMKNQTLPGQKNALDSYWLVLKAMAGLVGTKYSVSKEIKILEDLSQKLNINCFLLWAQMRLPVLHMLESLIELEDCPSNDVALSIRDWLVYDMVLVHQDHDVIGWNYATRSDKKILVDLFKLVVKYRIEYLSGDELAEAWYDVTTCYKNSGRHCTPMLLQRRWYQLKVATRERFLKYFEMYEDHKHYPAMMELIKPTALQVAIVAQFQSLLVEPVMSWKDLIINDKVILRQQFEMIALKKHKNGMIFFYTDNDDIIKVIERYQPNLAKDNNIENDSDVVLDSDEVIKKALVLLAKERKEKRLHFDSGKEDTEKTKRIKPNNLNNKININHINQEKLLPPKIRPEPTSMEIDIEEQLNISVVPKTMVLPKITNVFGNVSNTTLLKLHTLPSQIANTTDNVMTDKSNFKLNNSRSQIANTSCNLMTTESILKLNTLSSPISNKTANLMPSVPVEKNIINTVYTSENCNLCNNQNSGLTSVHCDVDSRRDADIFQSTEIDKIRRGTSVPSTNMPDEIKEHKIEKPKEPQPVVYATKLEDMGIIPTERMGNVVLSRIDDKNVLDVVSFKTSKRGIKKTRKETYIVKTIRRVKLSSKLLQKPSRCTYNIKDLIKNRDLNLEIKSQLPHVFKSVRNCHLIKTLKPVTVDLNKEFETELVNGRMYLDMSEDINQHTSKAPKQNIVTKNNKTFFNTESIEVDPNHILSEINTNFRINEGNSEEILESEPSYGTPETINNVIFLTTTKIPSNLNRLMKFQRKIKHILDELEINRETKRCNPTDCPTCYPENFSGYVFKSMYTQSSIHPDWRITTSTQIGNFKPEYLLHKILQLPLHNYHSSSFPFDKDKCSLGNFLSKALTRIRSVSELLYAYIRNGLFLTLDLKTQSLRPVNIHIRGLKSKNVGRTELTTQQIPMFGYWTISQE